jgi:hypothetical protein
MKFRLLAGLACLALVSCKAATPAGDWQGFTKTSIDKWMTLDPSFAVYQGAHQFDGKLPDWSAAGLKARGDFLRSVIADAGSYKDLKGKQAMERDYLVQVAKGQLFWLEEADAPHRNPHYYVNNGLDPNVYVSREYADKATRMKAMISFFKAIPKATADIRANLKTPMPASFVKFGVAGFGGFAEYYKGDAVAAFADVKDPALQAEMKTVSDAASKSMGELRDWVKGLEATATQDFALGGDKFAKMLSATEAVDISLEELEKVGRADLARNQKAVTEACAVYAPGATVQQCFDKMGANKPRDNAVAEATRQIPDLNAFIRKTDLLTIPGTEQALVRESPPYNRQNSAYIDPAGPLEKGVASIYYISPPDPSWPKAKQLEYIPGVNDLLFTSIHEIMPGHFLQFLHSNRSESMVGKLFVGYAFAEGWAHYSEELMWEAGYGNGNPEVHIGQISNALLRDCRLISAIGLHSKGMTQAQSKQLFMDECYQVEGTAEQQAARGTYDPAYVNYTMGKLLIRKLREDWTASRGGRKAWKEFHDTFLGFGGPPIPLVRQAMMNEDKPKAVF